MFCIVSSVFVDIGERFMNSVVFMISCLRIWVGTCMHEALFECLLVRVIDNCVGCGYICFVLFRLYWRILASGLGIQLYLCQLVCMFGWEHACTRRCLNV